MTTTRANRGPLGHQLRPRTHGTYVDAGDTLPVREHKVATGSTSSAGRSSSGRLRKAGRARRISPPTSPTPVPPAQAAPLEIIAAETEDQGHFPLEAHQWDELVASRKLGSSNDNGLHLLLSMGDAWLPFLRSWRDGNVAGMRGFANDVTCVVDILVEQVERSVDERKQASEAQAEYRRRCRYRRYAEERDAREDVRRLAKLLTRGAVGRTMTVGGGDGMANSAEWIDDDGSWDQDCESDGEENIEELTLEAEALADYLICY
ncbi:hypothetical protein P7C70_g8807, partial [Phenoliferia sp. Uapishka_3]